MPVTEKTRKSLQQLGLTDYEVRAYTSLLEHGAMTANKISANSGVPYSKIYEALGSLEKKGWIEAEHARPSKYYPKPPSEALESTKLRIESELKSNEMQVLSELQPLYEREDRRERPDIWIVRGEFNVLAKIRETISKSQKELLVAIPRLEKTVLEIVYPTLLNLSQAGVKITVMITREVGPEVVKSLSKVAEVGIRDQMFGGGIVSDAKEVMILLGDEAKERTFLAIWSDHIGLANFARNYFGYLWQDARGIRNS